MPHPAPAARIAGVPTSGHSLVGDAQISTSAREQRVDAGSSPLGCGPCKARTPRDYEACRECSPRDPSRDPSIRQPRYVVSAPITTTGDGPYCYGFRITESPAAPWPTTTSQNTSLSAYSQYTPFPAQPAPAGNHTHSVDPQMPCVHAEPANRTLAILGAALRRRVGG